MLFLASSVLTSVSFFFSSSISPSSASPFAFVEILTSFLTAVLIGLNSVAVAFNDLGVSLLVG